MIYRLIRFSLRCIDLLQHFPCSQIPGESVQSSGAESASHLAAHLRGYAERIAVAVLHEYALDGIAVFKAQQKLPSSVPSVLLHLQDFKGAYMRSKLQLSTKLLAEIRHLVKIRDAARHPFEQLFSAKRLFTQLCSEFLHFFDCKSHEVFSVHNILRQYAFIISNTAPRFTVTRKLPPVIYFQESFLKTICSQKPFLSEQ